MKTRDAVTPMPGLIVPFLTFTLLYCFLGVIVGWLLYRQILRSPDVPEWRRFYMPAGGRGAGGGGGGGRSAAISPGSFLRGSIPTTCSGGRASRGAGVRLSLPV